MKQTTISRIKKILLVIFLPLIMLARLIVILVAAYMISRGKPSYSYTEYEYMFGLKIWKETRDYYCDENGRVIKERWIDNTGDRFIVETQYDSLGRDVYESRLDIDFFVLPSWNEICEYKYYKDTELKTDRVCTAGSAKWEEHIEYDDEGNMVLKDGNEFGVYGLGFDEYNKSIFNEKGICIYNEFTDFDDFLPKANYGKPVVTVEYDPETNTVIGYDVRNRYGRTIICYIRDKRYEAQLTPDGNYDRVTYYYDDYYKDSSGDYHDARKIKQYEYDADKNCSGSTAITYDEDENMMKKDVFDPEDRNIFHAEYTDGAETLREETTYDPEGNETLYVKYEEGLETLRRETTYDPEGREILYVEYTEGLETLSRETDHNASDPDYPGENVRIVRTYQPDTDGEMILQEEERSKKFVMGGYWNFYNEKEADYHPYYSEIRIGDKMRVSLNSSFYDNGMINTRKFYEYDGYGIVEEEEIRKYDRHGNLIRESSFNDHGKLVPISEWKYTYRD